MEEKSFSSQENLHVLKMEETFQSYVKDFGLENFDLTKPILDAGAGKGSFIEYIRTRLHNRDAFAVDIFKRGTLSQNTPEWFMQTDTQDLPFRENTFSLTTARHIFPMFIQDTYPAQFYGMEMDYKKFIGELIRVTVPGGYIMFDYYSPEDVLSYINFAQDETALKKLHKRAEEAQKAIDYIQTLQNIEKEIFSSTLKDEDRYWRLIKK